MLIDLSGVHYIDSTRLGELIAAHVTVSRQGGRLKLVRTPPRVVELLVIAGLGEVFERFDSIEDAKKSFALAGSRSLTSSDSGSLRRRLHPDVLPSSRSRSSIDAGSSLTIWNFATISRTVFSSSTCSVMNHWSSAIAANAFWVNASS